MFQQGTERAGSLSAPWPAELFRQKQSGCLGLQAEPLVAVACLNVPLSHLLFCFTTQFKRRWDFPSPAPKVPPARMISPLVLQWMSHECS